MKKVSNLYWRVSLIFFITLLLVGASYIFITVKSSGEYVEQVNQRLNRNIAKDIAKSTIPLKDTGIDKKAIEDMIHSVMIISPSLEVYLLDTSGKIVAFYAPEKKVVRKMLSLAPILRFIKEDGTTFIKGDDPRHTGGQKIFSAAPVISDGMQTGYIYAILAGEEYDAVSGSLSKNYLWTVGLRSIAITFFITLLIGLLLIWVITRNYKKVVAVMEKFRQGDTTARVRLNSTGDIKQIGDMFNEMADILTENVEKLKAVETLRRELIANVSHDLRTPISIIHGYIETLQIKGASLSQEERNHYLTIVIESTEKLQKLVNELFELSKLEANQVQPQKEAFSISELVSDITSNYFVIAKEKNIIIKADLVQNLPPVLADISLIERVMQNLLDNAVKFTPQGGRIIVKTSQVGQHIAVSVSDTGIGVKESDQSKIFDRYYRGNDFVDLKNSTGLGLAIVKKILELHHSSLQLQSQKDIGSEFTFELPAYRKK
ncbi:MAG: ATP-binding protein [Chitinophagaceae bacterium]